MKNNFLGKFITFIAFTVLIISCKNTNEEKWELNSPDNNISIIVNIKKGENQQTSLVYEVVSLKDGKATKVIESSPLGINRKDEQFSENLSFVSKSDVKTIDETYTMQIGRQSKIRNNANEIELTFKNENGSPLQLVLRAYNDGVAFKYVFPDKSDKTYTVTKELTGFKVPESGKAWIQRYAKNSKWGPSYELYYENEIPIGTPSPIAEGWGFPALFSTSNHWILLSEANLSDNYCGVRLEQNAPNGLYKVRFPEAADAMGTGNVEPSYTLPWTMPWRTIIIGSSLSTIFESQMITNVSDPAISGDFSWVKPGIASWGWNTDHNSGKNYQALKEFVDLAAEMNWEYSLVDVDWDQMEGGNIEQLVKYANSKKVGILLWFNSGGPNNDVSMGPRDFINDAQKRKAEFKKLHELGVKGIKVDFWHSDKQDLIQRYLDVLKDAAENKLMVNFHGCTMPRGWSRTYPNLVGLEAFKGEENYDFDSTYPAEAPIQSSIVAFSRNVLGPMDGTPMTLTNLKYPHLTTYSHELALTMVYNCGILHIGDNVKSIRSLPEYVKTFLKEVPVAFDETRLISGEPGKSIVIAGRKGSNWFLAGINSLKENKEMIIELPFITSGSFQMSLITDGADAKSFANQQTSFTPGDQIKLNMPGFGGFLSVLKVK